MFAGVAQPWESGGATHCILLTSETKGLGLRAKVMSLGMILYKRRAQPWALSLAPHSPFQVLSPS